jgi:hypothetical protein
MPAIIRGIIRRTLCMMGIWTCFGVLIGAFDPRFSGRIGMIAAMIAWSLILSILGMFLGLVGGSYKESMIGGILGAAIAAVTVFALPSDFGLAMQVIFGLLIGGIIGATFLPWLHVMLKSANMILKGTQRIVAAVTPSV